MVCAFGHLLKAPTMRKFEATLQRKHCLSAEQSARTKRETVVAHDESMAREEVLKRRENQAFIVASIREVR